jgi:AraC-like DNA-binding protein
VLNIVRSGLVRQTQFGRKIETPSGYMCLVDSRSPFDTEQLMTTDALYIRIPGAPLRAAIGTPEDFCAIPIDLRSGLGAIFGAFLFSAWRERDSLAEEDRDVVAERMIDIFRSICGKLDNRRLSSITSMGTQIFQRAGRFIEANLGDPQLNPDRVAKSLRISRSHLHASFCGSGQTVGQTILSKRLERCHHLLANPQLAHRKITDIAFDCGFNDAAHFSRTFKAQFGVSPRAFRRQKLAAIPA